MADVQKKYKQSKHWNAELNKVNQNCSDASSINDYLSLVRSEVLRHYNILLTTREVVTADDVKNSYKGVKEIKKTFFQLFDQFMQHLASRKEINDLSEGRYKRFNVLLNKCRGFVKHKFKRTDVMLEDVRMNFIVEFEHYMRKGGGMSHNTAMKYAKNLKQIMKYGVMLEYIPSSPFELFQCTTKKTRREFLDVIRKAVEKNITRGLKRLRNHKSSVF